MTLSQDDMDKINEDGTPGEGEAAGDEGNPQEDGTGADAVRLILQGEFKSHLENIFSTLTGEELKVELGAEDSCQGDELPKFLEGEWLGFAAPLGIGGEIKTGHLISTDIAKYIAGKIMGQDAPEALEEPHLGALKETANNLIGAWATGLNEAVSIDVKTAGEADILEGDGAAALASAEGIAGVEVVIWHYAITAGEITGKYALVIPAKGLNDIVAALPDQAAGVTGTEAEGEGVGAKLEVEVEKAVFQDFEGAAPTGEASQIQLLLDVPLTVSVELGRKRLSIKEILDMVPGSLLELDKLAGEPVDLMVNGKLFAHGEVVVIDENFGVRIANIVSSQERLERLK